MANDRNTDARNVWSQNTEHAETAIALRRSLDVDFVVDLWKKFVGIVCHYEESKSYSIVKQRT